MWLFQVIGAEQIVAVDQAFQLIMDNQENALQDAVLLFLGVVSQASIAHPGFTVTTDVVRDILAPSVEETKS